MLSYNFLFVPCHMSETFLAEDNLKVTYLDKKWVLFDMDTIK